MKYDLLICIDAHLLFYLLPGSTGNPKGVMTSFKAMRDTTKGLVKVLKVTSNDRYLSYLPVAHGMERWIGEVSGFTCRSLSLFEDALISHPFVLPSVFLYTREKVSSLRNH